MSRKAISISIEREIINKIDTTKGKNEPRSRFIENTVSEFLKKEGSSSQHQLGGKSS